MRILVGVQFLFIKSLICKAFSILFNDIRLCGTPETVAAEPFSFSHTTPFNKRSRGVHFRQKGCAHFNYSSRVQKKGRKTRSPQCERPCDLVFYALILTSVPFLKTKVISPVLWTIAFSTITVQMVSLHSRSTTGCFLRVSSNSDLYIRGTRELRYASLVILVLSFRFPPKHAARSHHRAFYLWLC